MNKKFNEVYPFPNPCRKYVYYLRLKLFILVILQISCPSDITKAAVQDLQTALNTPLLRLHLLL